MVVVAKNPYRMPLSILTMGSCIGLFLSIYLFLSSPTETIDGDIFIKNGDIIMAYAFVSPILSGIIASSFLVLKPKKDFLVIFIFVLFLILNQIIFTMKLSILTEEYGIIETLVYAFEYFWIAGVTSVISVKFLEKLMEPYRKEKEEIINKIKELVEK